MNKDSQAGRLITPDEGLEFFKRVMKAEKVLGPLSTEERITILNTIGKEVTIEDLRDMLAGKRVLVVKEKQNGQL